MASGRGRVAEALVGMPYSVPAIVAAVVLIVLTYVVNPGFITRGGWVLAVGLAAPFMLLATAETPAILSGRGGVDLSVGPAAGLIAIVVATIMTPRGFDAPYLVIPAAILYGLRRRRDQWLAGGLRPDTRRSSPRWPRTHDLCRRLDADPVVAGGYGAALAGRGRWAAWARSRACGWCTRASPSSGSPSWRPGSAAGCSPSAATDRAAFTAGVDVAAVRLWAYTLTGALTGLAAWYRRRYSAAPIPPTGPPYTLVAVARAALGGVSLTVAAAADGTRSRRGGAVSDPEPAQLRAGLSCRSS